MSRIIAGNLKGKKIIAPKSFEVRPTTDFAKEAFFSIINHQYNIDELAVLDLFSGIGSISFEFVSRGCEDVTSIELNPQHCRFIQQTSKEFGIESKINVIRKNAITLVQSPSKKQYDVVFADPPFDFEEDKYTSLINNILGNQFLSEEGIFVLEHNSKRKFDAHPNWEESRKYGNVSFSFFSPKN